MANAPWATPPGDRERDLRIDRELNSDRRHLVTLLQARPDVLQAVDISEIQALHQKYLAVGNGGMCVLCRCVLDLDKRREAHADADRQFLIGVIRGTIDPVQEGFFDRVEPMFTVYANESGHDGASG